MKRALLFALIALLGLAQAQIVRQFDVRYSANKRGDILIIGNTLETCSGGNPPATITPSTPPTCDPNGTGSNNGYTMGFIDFDNDSTTFNSSAAQLNLPQGSTVLWAGLYWGGSRGGSVPPPDPSAIGQVSFRFGSDPYAPVTAIQTDTGINHPEDPYSAFADVTSIVQSNGPGTYWVANVQASRGGVAGGTFAGWALVVVYENPSEPLRNLVVYDGYLNQANTAPPTTITISGFLTPSSGPVQARIGFVAQEGDIGIYFTGDSLSLSRDNTTFIDLSEGSLRPADNFFLSRATRFGSYLPGRTPSYNNLLGFDLGVTQNNTVLQNDDSSAYVRFSTDGDGYYPQVLTSAIDIYVPDLTTTFEKSVTDPNGGQVLVGDELEYTISFTNTGNDGATNVVLRDPIPAGTQYVTGSLQVTQNAAGAPTGTFTDGSGDDIAEYDPSCSEFGGDPCVRFRLGTGANASSGGLIPPNEGATVKFRVQVLPSAAGQSITNTAHISYNSQTLGTSFSKEASDPADIALPDPPTVTKTFIPDSIPVGGTSTLTITLTNPNPTTATLTDDLVDTLPSGVVVASNPSASTDCGGSVTANPGDSTVTLSSGAQIPAGGSCTVTVNVTGSTAGIHTNEIPVGALQTNLRNNQDPASATLTVWVSISGQVYHDLEPNGAKNSGENWSDGPTVYVKLIQQNVGVVDSQTVNTGSGNFTFTGVLPGSYTLIVVSDPNDTTPTPPAGWRFINPPSGSRSVSVGNTNVGGQDFGLFHGGVVKGRVFYDDGEGSGTANNALQDGTERGVGSVTVMATDGTNTRTATTDGSGLYRLYIPASWGSVTLSHPVRPATGWNDGSNPPTPVNNWADAQSPSSPVANIGLGSAGNLAGQTFTRNFGVVRTSEFKPDQSGQITSPGTLTYAHLFRPGTLGSVNLTLENTPSFTYQARRDANCNGAWDSTEDFGPLPLNFTVDSTWPRDPDGRLTACALEVRVQAPAGLPAGYTDIALFKSSLKWQNNPSVTEERFLTDTTTVILAGQLKLSKQVRNATQNTSFATSAQAAPTEELEYRITYQNIGSQPIFDVVLQDPIPFFSTLVQNVYGTGEVELVCPDGTPVQIDLGPTSSISLNLATHCTLPSAPHPNGSSAEALLPGQGGYFVYRVQVQ